MRDSTDREAVRAAVAQLVQAAGARQVREALQAFGLREALRHLDRSEAQRRAVELLRQRVPRAEIARRLQDGSGLSRAVAYRVIAAALDQVRPSAETDQAHPPAIETPIGD